MIEKIKVWTSLTIMIAVLLMVLWLVMMDIVALYMLFGGGGF